MDFSFGIPAEKLLDLTLIPMIRSKKRWGSCLAALTGLISFVEILQVKYLNNLIEQDHCFIKKITNLKMGFKAFHSAQATLDGIETAQYDSKGTAV